MALVKKWNSSSHLILILMMTVIIKCQRFNSKNKAIKYWKILEEDLGYFFLYHQVEN